MRRTSPLRKPKPPFFLHLLRDLFPADSMCGSPPPPMRQLPAGSKPPLSSRFHCFPIHLSGRNQPFLDSFRSPVSFSLLSFMFSFLFGGVLGVPATTTATSRHGCDGSGWWCAPCDLNSYPWLLHILPRRC